MRTLGCLIGGCGLAWLALGIAGLVGVMAAVDGDQLTPEQAAVQVLIAAILFGLPGLAILGIGALVGKR